MFTIKYEFGKNMRKAKKREKFQNDPTQRQVKRTRVAQIQIQIYIVRV